MEWFHYLSGFFAGIFLANAVPHFIQGISGNKFPTPFAKPPGKGLSPAPVNVIWGLVNMLIGYCLFRKAEISMDNTVSMLVLFAGIAVISIPLSVHFQHKDQA